MSLSRKEIRRMIIREMKSMSSNITGNIELGYGMEGQERLVYIMTVNGQYINGSISGRQMPLIAADGVASCMDGSWEDGDLNYQIDNFSRIWAHKLKREHQVDIHHEDLANAVRNGSVNFRKMPKPRNHTFSY